MSKPEEPSEIGQVLLWCLVCWALLALAGIVWEMQSLYENQCRFPPTIDIPKDDTE